MIEIAGEGDNTARTAVLYPAFQVSGGGTSRTQQARLDEACGLAEAIDLEVVEAKIINVRTKRPSTLFGKGKVEELRGLIAALNIDVVIVDGTLTPVQQRNLETEWSTKILDRTGLILEIFSARARTKEGRLQVELAHLSYQKSRLVRSWTHLERQRGGLGFVGGPGETQIESDRRMIDERITKLRKQLEVVTGTRELHRAGRRKVPYPIVALVGYTNAGKSTLFNKLTSANVFAEDLLFATLDPTMREIELPDGKRIVLSDTVGFISELPTDLIAAFRATLEEVLEADVILHVSDQSSLHADAERDDVMEILQQLGVDPDDAIIVDVFNKMDLLPPDDRAAVDNRAKLHERQVALSAVTGEGIDELLATLDACLSLDELTVTYDLEPHQGKAIAWLYQHTKVLDRADEPDMVRMRVTLSHASLGRAEKDLQILPIDYQRPVVEDY